MMKQTVLTKKSRQRDAILENLRARYDHPTADAIYTDLRKTYPNISLGTVYRNLSLLADHGIISRVTCESKVEHFDARTDSHYHFICDTCGHVLDLPFTFFSNMTQMANENFAGQVKNHTAFFYGICPDCLSKEEGTDKQEIK